MRIRKPEVFSDGSKLWKGLTKKERRTLRFLLEGGHAGISMQRDNLHVQSIVFHYSKGLVAIGCAGCEERCMVFSPLALSTEPFAAKEFINQHRGCMPNWAKNSMGEPLSVQEAMDFLGARQPDDTRGDGGYL